VAGFCFCCQLATGFGQKNRAVGLCVYQTFALQSLHRANDGNVGDSQRFGEISGACLAAERDKVGDGFHVILRTLLGVLLTGPALVGGSLISVYRDGCPLTGLLGGGGYAFLLLRGHAHHCHKGIPLTNIRFTF